MFFIPLGSEAMNSSQYIKPNKTVSIESVECLGVENALMNCIYKQLPLDVGKQKLTESYVAGVSCKKSTSTSSTYVFPTPTPSMDTEDSSLPFNANNIIFGGLGSITFIGLILLFV